MNHRDLQLMNDMVTQRYIVTAAKHKIKHTYCFSIFVCQSQPTHSIHFNSIDIFIVII